jgi:dTDP-3,4-didehydro-2,6-dideoxy-alpha-D-glucose 3-reductase
LLREVLFRLFHSPDNLKMDKIKIGVLGCANIAQRSVIPAIKSLDHLFELVAVASRTHEKAEKFAKEFNCEAIIGYNNLINNKNIDALYIPLPTGLHKEWVNKALLADKHVYVEKSIASAYLDAEEMVANAKSKGLALMEGFMFQYHGQHKIVFDLLKQDTIGEIRHFYSSFCFPPLADDNYRYTEQIGGGALLDAAGYPLRAAQFILGDEFEVKSSTLYNDPVKATNIYGSAFLTNSGGVSASLVFGFDNFYQCRYEILGQKGKIIAEKAFTPKFNDSPQIIVETINDKKIINARPDNHFVKAFQEFYHIIFDIDRRQKHYFDILMQTRSLEQIKIISNL